MLSSCFFRRHFGAISLYFRLFDPLSHKLCACAKDTCHALFSLFTKYLLQFNAKGQQRNEDNLKQNLKINSLFRIEVIGHNHGGAFSSIRTLIG